MQYTRNEHGRMQLTITLQHLFFLTLSPAGAPYDAFTLAPHKRPLTPSHLTGSSTF